jgi:hypothetical protein
MPYFLTALQLSDKHKVTTPVNWKKGEDIIVHPSVSTGDAQNLFKNVVVHKASRPRILWRIGCANAIYSSPTSGLRRTLSLGENSWKELLL